MTTDAMRMAFDLRYVPETGRRVIAGKDVIIHCHHYNSRIQRTIESAASVDGRAIFVSSAEAVFAEQVRGAIGEQDEPRQGWDVAAALYSHLGLGRLDTSELGTGIVHAPHSHFVEGWNAGFRERSQPVCTLTEGYLQGAYHAIEGKVVDVREVECMIQGAPRCRFEVDATRTTPFTENLKSHPPPPTRGSIETAVRSNIHESKIIDALVAMPVHGNDEGLIPNFNVYLASLPADFYNLVSLRFVEEMAKSQLAETAQSLLTHDAETCGMNTFRGIMSSPEWDALIAPMVQDTEDAVHGIIAVSNALGWGAWTIQELVPAQRLRLVSTNGYEADGTVEYRGTAASPGCWMLSGVAAGIMELIYGEGPFQDRVGQFESVERTCRSCDDSTCSFETRAVE